ncbi:PP2C family protein-serine/threonine phosphatase [Streptomyces sulphureus]|uniref:PP2C family protein-serine/threonine phosphatase n=1 Tax=Streptomyces sulphureus TaxID=47758 RepID=UPI000477B174|nr:PP2C family protein-serine/threonine phosphatase [Streptomyces sulphureus]
MSTEPAPKVAGTQAAVSTREHNPPTAEPGRAAAAEDTAPHAEPPRELPGEQRRSEPWTSLLTAAFRPARSVADRLTAVQDQLTGWLADLSLLNELTARLARTSTLDDALHETLRAGASLVGAQRAFAVLAPQERAGPERTFGLGLGRSDIGELQTVPRTSAACARLLDAAETPPPPASSEPGAQVPAGEEPPPAIVHADIPGDAGLDPRHRQVAARLGYAASYAVPLASRAPVPHEGASAGRYGAAVWLYDEPARPSSRQRRLLELYLQHAGEYTARHLERSRALEQAAALRAELLPGRLPRVPGVALAVRHRTGPRGGGDWYDVLPLPEGAVGLSVGGVTGGGPEAVAAMGRLRASLRAYAVMEGEDPVAVLSDLELLLRLTERGRSATALFAHLDPGRRRVLMAGAGQCPPIVVGEGRAEAVETRVSAPLGMLACWEAPSAELSLRQGETLLLYSDGLLHRTGQPLDRAFARLHSAADCAPRSVRRDPERLVEHVLRTVLPGALADSADHPEDVVLLAARL